MNPVQSQPFRSKRITFYFAGNLCIAFLMLFALPVIHKSTEDFRPHTVINKGYVNAAISSGEADFMHNALKTTETARAMAYDTQVSTMTLMQFATICLATLFLLNSFLLFRLRREPAKATTPVVAEA